MKQAISQYSARIGSDPSLVQGAGGNVSWKEGGTLHVKASGTWLADAERKDIFVPVDLRDLRERFSQGEFDAKPVVVGDSQLRPSIETLLHAVMPQTVVVHTHPIDALAYLVKTDCAALLNEALADSCRWTLVDYHKPGPELGAAVYRAISGTATPPDAIFLANHGVIVAGANLDTVADIYKRLQQRLLLKARVFKLPRAVELPAELRKLGYEIASGTDVQNLAFDPISLDILRRHWALYPDHVVFLGRQPALFAAVEHMTMAADLPEYAIIPQSGVFIKADLNQNKRLMLQCYAEVLMRLHKADSIRSLSAADVVQLLDWEAEKYRSRIAQ
jgi:rhamnose utilization protein RhaD (predicted bifunctional aldolase and dehydrogenase)